MHKVIIYCKFPHLKSQKDVSHPSGKTHLLNCSEVGCQRFYRQLTCLLVELPHSGRIGSYCFTKTRHGAVHSQIREWASSWFLLPAF